ncbi:MAG: MFS transporter [Nevskia sp.]|nr:MFS transporter [Nevskia sp.]
METLDSTVIANALPAMARSLHQDPLHLSLAISCYLLGLSVFIPASGWIADRYGARRVFRNAIVVFVIGSAACAAAQNIGELILARVVQSVGGALMVPVGRLVLLRQVPKHDLVAAMSYVTIPALVAPIVGPPLGGLIVTYFSWRWIFLINLPIGLLGYWLVTRFIKESAAARPQRFDLPGWLLLGFGLAGAVFGFENLGKHILPSGLPPLAMAAGGVLLMLYVRHARTVPAPIVRLSPLALDTFRVSVVGGSLVRIGVGANSLLMPMMLQIGFGLSALASGLLTFSGAVGAIAMKTVARRLTRQIGFRRLMIGANLASATLLAASGLLRPGTPHTYIVALLLLSGFFLSLQFTCVNTLAFSDVSERDMSQATTLASTGQQLAMSVGIGVGSQVLNLSSAARHATDLSVGDFSVAFCIAALISLLAQLSFGSLKPHAGSNVSGHRASGGPARMVDP